MKTIISIFITILCIIALVVGIIGCNGEQAYVVEEDILNNPTIDSLMFSLDGVIYTFPVHFSDLEANSWVLHDSDDNFANSTLEPDDVVPLKLITDTQTVGVEFTNLSDKALLVRESYIISISALDGKYNGKMVLPGNIMIGSDVEDVLSTYGTPDYISDGMSLLFYDSDHFLIQLMIDLETNKITMTNIRYWS
ncbi:MAG: hypothetical protein LBC73_01820 [Oscillospiraceae bacterium]|jgi:hypothetical protein|nr:hypothetical protein [Oscillospiraceae bacterium]